MPLIAAEMAQTLRMNCDGNGGESSEEGGGDSGEEGGECDHVTTVNMDDWETRLYH